MREKWRILNRIPFPLGKLKTRRTAFSKFISISSNESAIRNARRNHSSLLCGNDVAICSLKDFSLPV